MAGSNQQEKSFFKEIYSCGMGKLIQSSPIDAILSASEIRQEEIRLRPELSDGTATVRCHGDVIGFEDTVISQLYHRCLACVKAWHFSIAYRTFKLAAPSLFSSSWFSPSSHLSICYSLV